MIEKINKNFDQVSFFCIAVITFLLPLFFLPSNILSVAQSKISLLTIGTIIALIFFLIDRLQKGKVALSKNPAYLLIFLIVITTSISSFFGINQSKSFFGSLVEQDTLSTIIAGFLFAFLVANVSRTEKRIGLLLKLFFSSVVISMFARILYFPLSKYLTFSVLSLPVGTLSGSWSDLTLLSLMLLGSLVIMMEIGNLRKKFFALFALLLIFPFFFVALSVISFDFYFLSVSAGTFIAILSIVMFAYMFSLKRAKNNVLIEENAPEKKTSKLSPSLLLLSLSIVLVVFGGPISSFFGSKTGVQYIEGRPNWQATTEIVAKVLPSHLFFGTGPNTFDTEWNLNKTPAVNNYVFWNNDFTFGIGIIPTYLVTLGIVGFLLYLLFYVYIIWLVFKTLFKSGKEEGGYVYKILVGFGVLATTFVMFFYTPGIVVQFAHLLFIGLLVGLNQNKLKSKTFLLDKSQWRNFVSVLLSIAVIIVSLYWIYIVALKGFANHYWRLAMTSSDLDAAIVLVQKSVSLDPRASLYYKTMSELYLAKIVNIVTESESVTEKNKDEINTYVNLALQYATTAESIDPLDYRARISTGKILEFLGTLGFKDAGAAALDRYKYASSINPSNPLPYLFISNLSMNGGDEASAKEYLLKALSLKSNYSDVPDLGNQIQELINKLEKVNVPAEPVATTTEEDTEDKENE